MPDDDPFDDNPFDDIFDAFDRFVDDLLGTAPPRGERPIVSAKGVKVDVHEQEDRVEVVADLPGADVDDVELRCDGETLQITTDDYDSTVDLQVPVDETSAEAEFNNGVLSVAFDREERDGATLDLS